ncbi:hypothetical protein RRG08_025891 [Elysia crispata]|uniref:Uncharacterized protein n=1 Tax=Elysia crispata TaxID=231223 RepID=A0AAE0ZPJ1_9GAST|nr:hypothetical protein RRG08_025891 [Elysia crispata]
MEVEEAEEKRAPRAKTVNLATRRAWMSHWTRPLTPTAKVTHVSASRILETDSQTESDNYRISRQVTRRLCMMKVPNTITLMIDTAGGSRDECNSLEAPPSDQSEVVYIRVPCIRYSGPSTLRGAGWGDQHKLS